MAKKFISHKFNIWHRDRANKQLKCGAAQVNVKVLVKMPDLKLLHARWIAEMYNYLKQQTRSILNRFGKADITKAVKGANEVCARFKNPFTEKRPSQNFFFFFHVAFFLLRKTNKIFKYMC